MGYIRQEIHGTDGQNINKLNENFMNIFSKVFGDINFSDTDKDTQKRIQTQWLPVQGEGNLDKNYPMNIRFFIPPNTKTITTSNFNMICENYRMDSSVTAGGGGFAGGDINLSISGGGGGSTSVSYEGDTSHVDKWGWLNDVVANEFLPPTSALSAHGKDVTFELGGYYKTADNTLGAGVEPFNLSGYSQLVLDLVKLQHSHKIPPHSHTVNFPSHSHTGTASIEIPEHEHKLKEGIFISTSQPENVCIYLNDNHVATFKGLEPINNQDWSKFMKIGEWNTIKVTTSNLARVTIYGTIEVVINN